MSNQLPEFNLPQSGDSPIETNNQTAPQVNANPEVDATNDGKGGEQEVKIDPNAQAIYNIYRDEGFINSEDEFGGTFEALRDTLIKESRTREDAILTSLVGSTADFAQPLLEVILNKGADLNKEEFFNLVNSLQDPSYDKNNLNSEAFLTDYYSSNLGWSEEDIQDRIDKLKDTNRLDAEATSLFERYEATKKKAVDDTVQSARDSRQNRNQQLADYNAGIQNAFRSNYVPDKARTLQKEFMTGA